MLTALGVTDKELIVLDRDGGDANDGDWLLCMLVSVWWGMVRLTVWMYILW